MKKLYDKEFYLLWGQALASGDRDMFVAVWAMSILWGEPTDLTDEDLIEQADYVGKIWDAAHMTTREICAAAGLTQAAFATRFCIPKRTVEDWCRGTRTPPDYVRLMILKLLGLLQ